MSKLAIVDLGSNTCRLVLFDVSPEGAFRLTDQVSETVRIGADMFDSGMLQPVPVQRAVQLLKMYAGLCSANRIEHVIATATSAVRDALNGKEFVERVRRETGLALQILTGQAEAFYAYVGAMNGFAIQDGLIADLGGGSLELMHVKNRRPAGETSLPLGAVRLSDQFLQDDPIPKSAVQALVAHIDSQLQTSAFKPSGETLIALGGTARALAQVDQRRRNYPLERLHGYELSADAVEDICRELLKKDYRARLKIKGLKDERADIIPAGAVVIRQLMRAAGARSLLISGRGLREGLLYEHLLKNVYGGTTTPLAETAHTGANNHAPLVLEDVRAFGIANLSFLYQVDWVHARQVCHLALELFDGLASLHGFGDQERALVAYASILHDSGVLIDYYRHHHHSAYLIENADLPGFTQREIALLALVVRWHRRGEPTLEPYEALCRKGDAQLVEKLVACLRLAEALERSRAQLVRHVHCRITKQNIHIRLETRHPADAELWAANRETALWQQAFGRDLNLSLMPATGSETLANSVEKNVLERMAFISSISKR